MTGGVRDRHRHGDIQFPGGVLGFIPGLNNAMVPLSTTTTMRREY